VPCERATTSFAPFTPERQQSRVGAAGDEVHRGRRAARSRLRARATFDVGVETLLAIETELPAARRESTSSSRGRASRSSWEATPLQCSRPALCLADPGIWTQRSPLDRARSRPFGLRVQQPAVTVRARSVAGLDVRVVLRLLQSSRRPSDARSVARCRAAPGASRADVRSRDAASSSRDLHRTPVSTRIGESGSSTRRSRGLTGEGISQGRKVETRTIPTGCAGPDPRVRRAEAGRERMQGCRFP